MLRTLSFITSHPLTRNRPISALVRFAGWQIRSRLKQEIEFEWIDGAKLIVRNGMTGATGNIYCGLHEFADMAFLLHLLRPGDIFVDVGANIGSYTILASAVCGAETVAVEPDPETTVSLQRNILANRIGDRVLIIEAALGANSGVANFTVGRDTLNHITTEDGLASRNVRVERLDDMLGERNPILIKLDVEGYENEVLLGGVKTLLNPSLFAVEVECRAEPVREKLIAAGFTEFRYQPINRQLRAGISKEHANALFIRNYDACVARLQSSVYRNILGLQI